jgi:hypothetical protein
MEGDRVMTDFYEGFWCGAGFVVVASLILQWTLS